MTTQLRCEIETRARDDPVYPSNRLILISLLLRSLNNSQSKTLRYSLTPNLVILSPFSSAAPVSNLLLSGSVRSARTFLEPSPNPASISVLIDVGCNVLKRSHNVLSAYVMDTLQTSALKKSSTVHIALNPAISTAPVHTRPPNRNAPTVVASTWLPIEPARPGQLHWHS